MRTVIITKEIDLCTNNQNKSVNFLSRFFQQFMTESDIKKDQLVDRIIEYVDSKVENNKKAERAGMALNLVEEIQRPIMTWKIFIKSLRILKVSKIQMSFTLTLNE